MHGKDTRIFGGAFDFSAIVKGSSAGSPVDMAENTTYQSQSKTYEPGLDDGQLALEAIFSNAEIIEIESWAKADTYPWTRLLDGAAVGNGGESLLGLKQSIDVSSPVGDIVQAAITVQADGGVDRVVSLHDVIASETAAGQESSHDSGAASANGGVAVVHLIGFTGTSISIKIEDSANDSTFADLATFTALTDVGSEHVVVAEGTTVDRYLRAAWTGTFTSATFVVTFGRR